MLAMKHFLRLGLFAYFLVALAQAQEPVRASVDRYRQSNAAAELYAALAADVTPH